MRILVLTVFFLLAAFPVSAQSAETCPGAQDWYDSIDESALRQYFTAALSQTAKIAEKVRSLDAINDIADEIEDSNAPRCLGPAPDWYAAGLRQLSSSLEILFEDITVNDLSEFALSMAKAQSSIGQFRGYLVALGVEIVDPDGDNPIAVK